MGKTGSTVTKTEVGRVIENKYGLDVIYCEQKLTELKHDIPDLTPRQFLVKLDELRLHAFEVVRVKQLGEHQYD